MKILLCCTMPKVPFVYTHSHRTLWTWGHRWELCHSYGICKRTHLQGFITWDTLCHRIIISLLFGEKNPRMLHFARNNNKVLNIFLSRFFMILLDSARTYKILLNIFLDQSSLLLLANLIYANSQLFHCGSYGEQFY